MSTKEDGTFVTVQDDNGYEGLLNAATGQVLVPTAYGDSEVVNADWQTGIALVAVDGEEGDYKSWTGGQYYNIDYVDVFYRGTKVATLTREEYRGGYPTAHATFLDVRL